MSTTRRPVAIAADVVCYSRVMGIDEVATLQEAHRHEVVDPAIAAPQT